MNILVTGSNGQLGSELKDLSVDFPQYRFHFTDIAELDICDAEKVLKYLKTHKIAALINCAAYTQVDKAEDEKPRAALLNSTGARILAEACAQTDTLMVHISTDYVFDGKNSKPYTESENTSPKTIYGKTKLDGEVEVMFNSKRAIIIRTSWLYSTHGHNFVKTILNKCTTESELKVVFDQVGCPTYARDLAMCILEILPKVPSKVRGEIYNFSNEGVASWYDFARAIIEIKGLECKVMPVLSTEFKQNALRPHFSVLNKCKIKKEFGVKIPYWRDSLTNCLSKM
ncbi:MAG TPA: dTDP-4-dehydrorhamnose reductase [Bacteroidales bacterium]|nr:dTDP-4-dehydrorhamnose reductase [Bacteroidales bacterium]